MGREIRYNSVGLFVDALRGGDISKIAFAETSSFLWGTRTLDRVSIGDPLGHPATNPRENPNQCTDHRTSYYEAPVAKGIHNPNPHPCA